MRVSEWFYSIQGEGVTAGKPSLFIRLSGCNFMCGGFKAKLLAAKKATWYCLDGDTSIIHRIGNGGKAPIKDVKVGDTVLGYDEANHRAVPTKVVRKIEHTITDTNTYIVTTLSGSVIEATAEHPFFVDEKWIRADELSVGDEIYHVTGEELRSLYSKYRDTSYMQDRGFLKRVMEGRVRAGVYEKASDRMRKNNPMKNPETVKKNWAAHMRKSKIEEKLEEVFTELPIVYTGDGSLWIAGKNPDFRVKGQRKVIEVYSSSFQYRNKENSPYYRDESWRSQITEHYRKHNFEVLLLDMDREGALPNRSPSGHISAQRAEHLQAVVGKFVHNGDPIVSIEIKHYDEKAVHNLECFPYKNFFVNRLLSHNCDTESVWKAGRERSVDELMNEIFTQYPKLKDWIAEGKANIILTGGEPTLPHNIEAIKEIQEWFHTRQIFPYYEVETNGSVVVDYETLFDQINASPKLANSGMPARLRQNREAIDAIKAHPNAWFKFVVNIEDDIREIENEWIAGMGVPEDRIILMPGVDKLEHLQSTSLFAAEKAIERGWKFSSRLQVSIWDQTTGV